MLICGAVLNICLPPDPNNELRRNDFSKSQPQLQNNEMNSPIYHYYLSSAKQLLYIAMLLLDRVLQERTNRRTSIRRWCSRTRTGSCRSANRPAVVRSSCEWCASAAALRRRSARDATSTRYGRSFNAPLKWTARTTLISRRWSAPAPKRLSPTAIC